MSTQTTTPTLRPRLALLCIGDELMDGRTGDRNARALGSLCSERGWELSEIRFVPDEPAAVSSAIGELLQRAPLLVTSGGLGPTLDDRTRAAVAAAAGVATTVDLDVLKRLEAKYAARGRAVATVEARQAEFPVGATIYPSTVGTADGFSMEHDGGKILCLPGVPREFIALAVDLVPRLAPPSRPSERRTLVFFGRGEGAIGGDIEALNLSPSIVVTSSARSPLVEVVLRAESDHSVELEAADGSVSGALTPWALPPGASTVEEALVSLAGRRGERVSVAESCTGGYIASAITNVPGASSVFERSWVTYANEAKTDMLGVDAHVLATHGAVSGQVAAQMVRGVTQRSGAELAMAVTGIAGPSGGSEAKPVGLVFLGVATPVESVVLEARFVGRDRTDFKRATTALAMLAVIRCVEGRAALLRRIDGVVSLGRLESFDE